MELETTEEETNCHTRWSRDSYKRTSVTKIAKMTPWSLKTHTETEVVMKIVKDIYIIIKEKVYLKNNLTLQLIKGEKNRLKLKTVDRLNIGLGQAAARIIKHNTYLKKSHRKRNI